MKLYAVIIGRKGRNKRYVAYQRGSTRLLAVFNTREEARLSRKDVIFEAGHKDVHVVIFYGPNH